MAKKKNSIKKEKIIEVLQQIPEKDLRSFFEKIICSPVVKARFPLFQISIGIGRAMSHGCFGKMEERKSNKCDPLFWEPLLRVPGIQDSPVLERS